MMQGKSITFTERFAWMHAGTYQLKIGKKIPLNCLFTSMDQVHFFLLFKLFVVPLFLLNPSFWSPLVFYGPLAASTATHRDVRREWFLTQRLVRVTEDGRERERMDPLSSPSNPCKIHTHPPFQCYCVCVTPYRYTNVAAANKFLAVGEEKCNYCAVIKSLWCLH